MKQQLLLLLLLITNQMVVAYLGERHSPFIVTLMNKKVFKRGETIQINWGLIPGVRFPLYGYASARTSKTDIGLLAPDASRTQSYLYMIDTDVPVLDYSYSWIIDDTVPTGTYQIGVGFFYHEVSPEIRIVD